MASRLIYNMCFQPRAVSQLLCIKPNSTISRTIVGHKIDSSPCSSKKYSSSPQSQSRQDETNSPKPQSKRFKERTEAVQNVQISERLRLVKPGVSHPWSYSIDPQKILVIFLPFLNSKKKHVDGYAQIYLDLGFDVLCVKSKPQDFIWPPNSFSLAHELTEVLKECENYDHYIFHSMSIGSYNLTTVRYVPEFSDLNQKVCGIIYDSLVIGVGKGGTVDASNVDDTKDDGSNAIDKYVKGVTNAFKGSQLFVPAIKFAAKSYFTLTKKHTLDFYEKSYNFARHKPAKVPTLVLGSDNDPLSDKHVVEEVTNLWKEQYNVPTTLHMWQNSEHARHLALNRKEYLDVHKKFLDEVLNGLAKDDKGSKMSFPSKL